MRKLILFSTFVIAPCFASDFGSSLFSAMLTLKQNHHAEKKAPLSSGAALPALLERTQPSLYGRYSRWEVYGHFSKKGDVSLCSLTNLAQNTKRRHPHFVIVKFPQQKEFQYAYFQNVSAKDVKRKQTAVLRLGNEAFEIFNTKNKPHIFMMSRTQLRSFTALLKKYGGFTLTLAGEIYYFLAIDFSQARNAANKLCRVKKNYGSGLRQHSKASNPETPQVNVQEVIDKINPLLLL